jgi:hypothetical protein
VKSYFLQNIRDTNGRIDALSLILPGQSNPWVLHQEVGDPVAYFNIVDNDGEVTYPAISADMCGHHYNSDAQVIKALSAIQEIVGGDIVNDA